MALFSFERFSILPEVFTFDDFSKFYGNERSARTAIANLVSNGIKKVKLNVWKKKVQTMDAIDC